MEILGGVIIGIVSLLIGVAVGCNYGYAEGEAETYKKWKDQLEEEILEVAEEVE